MDPRHNQGAQPRPWRGSPEGERTDRRPASVAAGAAYLAVPVAAAYFLRNLSTRPAVSTIFCLPV